VLEILAATPDLTVRRVRAHIEIGMNNVFKTPGFADAMCRGSRLAGCRNDHLSRSTIVASTTEFCGESDDGNFCSTDG
jgi:hypothetical protein